MEIKEPNNSNKKESINNRIFCSPSLPGLGLFPNLSFPKYITNHAKIIISILLAFQTNSVPAENYAMVIGVSDYIYSETKGRVVDLEFPDDDARDLRAALINSGYKVFALIDDHARREDILDIFGELRRIIKEDDSFILFFAGHGVRDQDIGHTYWLTHDTALYELDHNGIRLNHLLDYVSDIKAKRKLVLLDHCFSGDIEYSGGSDTSVARDASTVTINTASRAALPVDEFKDVANTSSEGIAIFTAARNLAYEHLDYQNGIFTEALLKAMETHEADTSNDMQVSLTELESYIKSEVESLSAIFPGAPQLPTSLINVKDVGDWILFPLSEIHSDVTTIVDRYKHIIAAWTLKDPPYIEQKVQVRLFGALSSWKESGGDLGGLSPQDKKLIDTLNLNMIALKENPSSDADTAEILNMQTKIIFDMQ